LRRCRDSETANGPPAQVYVDVSEEDADNEYDKNIQIADMNALNAALAVMKWKKLFGFYADNEREHYSTYTIDTNLLTSDET
jgi:hypothetical protein